jgi:hypothetical protein
LLAVVRSGLRLRGSRMLGELKRHASMLALRKCPQQAK